MTIAQRETTESDPGEMETLVDLLSSRARTLRDRIALQFLSDVDDAVALRYGELDQAARRIAVGLRQQLPTGSRAALVFPAGLDFVKAFFGCVYAGVLPVPATYPKPRRRSARLSAIVNDCSPAALVTTSRVLETGHGSQAAGIGSCRLWLSLDELETNSAESWQAPETGPLETAFLQYTSGSTTDPRGVEVSHRNICHNLEMIRQGFGLSRYSAEGPPEVGVSWLPAYHDMGLIGGILESLYVGGTTILMSPLSILQRPLRWLQTISDHRAVVSGGPNFAFELCLRKIKAGELSGLDLSSWRVAFCGAEPVRVETLRKFAKSFSGCGFREDAFYPCYGLAEATLLVTGGQGPGDYSTCNVRALDLQAHGNAVAVQPDKNDDQPRLELVGCGRPLMDEEVIIVDPQTNQTCPESTVGEIWLRGQNVARGYWGRIDEEGSNFNARLANFPEKQFLRTGDLGFLRNGSLFVTGRLKELLIIRGRNHYPHDLEATVQETSHQLIPGGGAAFLAEHNDQELLVLVQEVDRANNQKQRESMLRDIRRAVVAEHDVFVHEVVLIRQGTLSRTTSGKVRYSDVRQQYSDGTLSVLSRWSFVDDRSSVGQRTEDDLSEVNLSQLLELPQISDRHVLAMEIETRLITWLNHVAGGEIAGGQRSDLGPQDPFADYGLDSLSAVELIGKLEESLGLKLSPTVAWTYPTPADLSRHLAELLTAGDHVPDQSGEQASDQDDFDQLLSQLEELPDDQVAGLLIPDDASEKPQ